MRLMVVVGKAWRLSLCATVLLFVTLPLFAQVNTGRILGAVTDQSGGAIAGAAVTVTNTQTGVVRNLVTDAAGAYLAPTLSPGTYTVRVTATGFQAVERPNTVVEIGKDVRIDAQLVPGSVSQTIQVTSAAPMVDTSSNTLSGTLDNTAIADLPLNGRNYEDLLSLRPGVELRPGGGSLTQDTNGLRPEDNNYFINGLNDNEPFDGQSIVNSTLPSGDAATILPIDAIQEYNVETNPPAEFGGKPGSVVNVALKSGTNIIHGSAYAFGREQSFDARDYFNAPPSPLAPLAFVQWGGVLGGPIVKDKLFYFGGFERQSYTVGNTFTGTIPTTAAGAGPGISIPDAEAALAAQGIAVSPVSAKLLPLFGANDTNSASVPLGFPDIIAADNALGKMDYVINSHNSVNGSYFFGNGTSTAQDTEITQPQFRSIGTLRAEFVTADWTWTPNSSLVNELRGGWDYYNRNVFTADHNVPASSYGLNTGVTNPDLGGLPAISVSGFTQLGGGNNWPSLHGPNSDSDFVDQVSYLRGKHAIKIGGEFMYTTIGNAAFSSGRGHFFFTANSAFPGSTALESFLAGDPGHATVFAGNGQSNLRQSMYAGFIEDSWRLTSQLTLNYGVRYDYFTPLSSINNHIGNWQPAVGLEQVGVNINSAYNGDPKDFAPRLGLAWDVRGKGTTVVRMGYGRIYTDMVASMFMNNVGTANAHAPGLTSIPTGNTLVLPNGTTKPGIGNISTSAVTFKGSQLSWTPAGPVFPAAAVSANSLECGNGVAPNPAPCSILSVNRNLPNPAVDTWNISLQHSLTNNLSLEADYVGNHSGDLPGIVDVNQLNPQSAAEIACGHCEAVADRPYGTQYPYLGFINYLSDIDASNYNALQATLTGRNYHKLSFVFGYTYSHALDDSTHYFNQALPQNSLAPGADYGSSDFDIRNHFTISLTYNLPGKKSWGQLLQGWQVNSLVVLQSGLPWSAVDASDDVSRTGEFEDRWDIFGSPSNFAAGPAAIPFYPGGSANMPASCVADATTVGALSSLANFGCYAEGGSVLIAPPIGTFGDAGRNIFRSSGYYNWDFSLFKNWTLKERLTAQFRAEFFNVLNHPNLGDVGTVGDTDPSSPQQFGCECATPDVAATNPILGSGGPREIQLGMKLTF